MKLKKTNTGKIRVGQCETDIKEKRMNDTLKSNERRRER
jgi:hypothetical protein